MTYLGITYNTKEGTIKVREIVLWDSYNTPQVGDAMMQRLKKALEMVEGKEELTMGELTELKWAIYFVNCHPEKGSAIDECLDLAKGTLDKKIKITRLVKEELRKWKEWDGVHKISEIQDQA